MLVTAKWYNYVYWHLDSLMGVRPDFNGKSAAIGGYIISVNSQVVFRCNVAYINGSNILNWGIKEVRRSAPATSRKHGHRLREPLAGDGAERRVGFVLDHRLRQLGPASTAANVGGDERAGHCLRPVVALSMSACVMAGRATDTN